MLKIVETVVDLVFINGTEQVHDTTCDHGHNQKVGYGASHPVDAS